MSFCWNLVNLPFRLLPHIKNNIGLVFLKGDLVETRDLLVANKVIWINDHFKKFSMFFSRLCPLKFLNYVGKCEFVDSKLSIVIVYGIRSKLQPRPVLSLPWMSMCLPKPPPWGLRKPLSSKLCRSPPRLPEGALKSWSVYQRRTVLLNSTVVENLALLVIYKKIWFESVFYVTFYL